LGFGFVSELEDMKKGLECYVEQTLPEVGQKLMQTTQIMFYPEISYYR